MTQELRKCWEHLNDASRLGGYAVEVLTTAGAIVKIDEVVEVEMMIEE